MKKRSNSHGIPPSVFNTFIIPLFCEFFNLLKAKKEPTIHRSRLLICKRSLHHHRLLATVCKGEHKPSVVVDGNALHGGAKTAVLPFGIEEVELAKLK